MGTTARYALPYPELSDPADVPTDMQELAARVEAVIGPAATFTGPATSVPPSTPTRIPMTAKTVSNVDPENIFQLSGGNCVVQQMGIYIISVHVQFATTGGDERLTMMYVGGVDTLRTSYSGSLSNVNMPLTAVWFVGSGQAISPYAFHQAGAAINVQGGIGIAQLAR